MKRLLWSRHSNAGSVWTFVAAFPLLIAGLYRRDARVLGATLLFVALNPFLFRAPVNDRAWATRVVLGEQVWLHRGLRRSRATVLALLSTPVFLVTIASAARQRRRTTIAGAIASIALMMLFFRAMVRLYEESAPPSVQDNQGAGSQLRMVASDG